MAKHRPPANDALDRFGPLTVEEAIHRARSIIDKQPLIRDEAKWADAFYDLAVLIGRVQHHDGDG